MADRAPQLVLVHSPFVGPSSWRGVGERLRGLGYPVAVPELRLSELALPYYPALARRIAMSAVPRSDRARILVAHSGAGGLLQAAAEAMGGVDGAIFVDAILPHPGRCWFDTAPLDLAARLKTGAIEGQLARWDQWFKPDLLARLIPDAGRRDSFVSDLEPAPLAYGEESAPVCADWPPARLGYLQLSSGYAAEAVQAAAWGWRIRRRLIHHLATFTEPDRVAESLHVLIGALMSSA